MLSTAVEETLVNQETVPVRVYLTINMSSLPARGMVVPNAVPFALYAVKIALEEGCESPTI
jgi:hypothetical protein